MPVISMENLQKLILEEEGKTPKGVKRSFTVRYELQFIGNDNRRTVHKVEVKSVDFYDVIRHLRQGDSVLITPKIKKDLHKDQGKDPGPWYFAHI
jgi:hypothetical protein